MGLDILPDDLLSQILIRLPPKSLLLIRCVCKSWHSLITTSHFISLHLNHTHNHNTKPTVLFRRFRLDSRKETYTLHDDNEHFHEIETLYFPFKNNGCHTILGCVNGLVCLCQDSPGMIMLWNPFIRKCYTLPKCCDAVNCVGLAFGFGYDALADDYKVVRTLNRIGRNDCCSHHGVGCVGVGVFSLRARSWRSVGCFPDCVIVSRPQTVEGVIYRIAESDDNGFKIVSFDLSSEAWCEIVCPEVVRDDFDPCKPELWIFRDSLALSHMRSKKRYDIWVLNDSVGVKSWTKIFAIDLEKTVYEKYIAGLSMNGLAVMLGRGSLKVKPIVDCPMVVDLPPCGREFYWRVASLQESLVLLLEGVDVDFAAQNNGGYNEVEADEAPMIILD